jgi:HEAT repeat protein
MTSARCIALIAFSFSVLFCQISQDGETELLNKLIKDLTTDQQPVRESAAKTLGQLVPQKEFSHKQAVAAMLGLIDTMLTAQPTVRSEAEAALCAFVYHRGINPGEVKEIAPSFHRLWNVSDKRRRLYLVDVFAVVSPERKAEAVDLCMAFSRNGSTGERFTAAYQLAALDPGRDEAVPFLAECLSMKDGHAPAATMVLRTLGPTAKSAIPALQKALKVQETDVRIGAAEALAVISPAHGPEAARVAIEVLDDPEWRGSATQVLALIGPSAQGAVAPLRKILKELDAIKVKLPTAGASQQMWNDYLRRQITRVNVLWALVRLDPSYPTARAELFKMLQDADSFVRLAALFAIKNIATQAADAVPAIIETINRDRKQFGSEHTVISACKVLGEIGPAAKLAVPVLEELSSHSCYLVQQAAEVALKKVRQ